MPPKNVSTRLNPVRLNSITHLRVRAPVSNELSPCAAVMSAMLSTFGRLLFWMFCCICGWIGLHWLRFNWWGKGPCNESPDAHSRNPNPIYGGYISPYKTRLTYHFPSIAGCWASAGPKEGCVALEQQLRECMDSHVRIYLPTLKFWHIT